MGLFVPFPSSEISQLVENCNFPRPFLYGDPFEDDATGSRQFQWCAKAKASRPLPISADSEPHIGLRDGVLSHFDRKFTQWCFSGRLADQTLFHALRIYATCVAW